MKQFLRLAAFLAAFTFSLDANAATCFWVGGTNTYSTANGASWSSGTGGAGSTCAATGGIPKQAGDIATFDALSGGGTVTVDGTMNGVTMASITMGAFTGTLDFSANNPSLTLTSTFSITGSGTRTLNLGSGTFTLTATSGAVLDLSTVTGLTFNANTSTILLSATATTARTLPLSGKAFNNLTVTNPSFNAVNLDFASAGSFTVANLTFTNVGQVRFPAGATVTISGTLSYSGSSSNQGVLYTNAGAATISVAGANSNSWLAVQNITKAGAGSLTVTNGFDLGGNTGITITPPSGGGGGRIIGG